MDRSGSPLVVDDAAAQASDVLQAVSEAVIASEDFLESVLTGVLAKQHVLIEDVPGTGKTLTARSLAIALGLDFNRIQFTPDLLPADITGSTVFEEGTGEFAFNEGPIFANVVLADEINRAPPKTQSALLEAMEEKQVSVGGETHQLPDPFFVIATQNPIEQEGTFALPESQRDRFMVKSTMGYPDSDSERELLDRRLNRVDPTPTADRVTDPQGVRDLQRTVEQIHVEPEVREYLVALSRATREHEAVEVGVSPRGLQRHLEASRARALLQGRDFVTPDDVKSLATKALAHRLVLRSSALVEGRTQESVVKDIVEEVAIPSAEDWAKAT